MPNTESPSRMLRRYAYGLLQFTLDVICTFPSQRVRRWLLRHVFGLKMGSHTVIYRSCEIRAPWKIRLGAGTSVGGRVALDGRGRINIGNNVNISSEVMLWTAQHDYRDPMFKTLTKPITLEDYVWLGPRVIVLPGVTVKEGCVVGAAAVITEDTEPYGVYIGIPARRIGERPRNVAYSPGKHYTPFV